MKVKNTGLIILTTKSIFIICHIRDRNRVKSNFSDINFYTFLRQLHAAAVIVKFQTLPEHEGAPLC